MSNIPKRQRWSFRDKNESEINEFSLLNLVDYYMGLMFNRTLEMFEYKNLPNNMTKYDMEKFTQLKGKSIFLKGKDRFYILDGSPWNDITWNYEPDKALVVNPALPYLNTEYKLGVDAVLVRNDYLMMGLGPIFEKNSLDLANTDISLKFAQFNTRFKNLTTSDDDNVKASIDKLMTDIWNGLKPYAIHTTQLYKSDTVKNNPVGYQNTDIKDLMELRQYQLAQFFIELCLNANYNMKRENIGKSEATLMNEDVIIPLIDQMLNCRRMAIDEINRIYGLEIEVDLSSAWKKIQEEVIMDLAKQEADVKAVENQANEPDEPNNEGGVENEPNEVK